MSRRAARESALQVLFQVDIGKNMADSAISFVVGENALNEQEAQYVRQVVLGVLENLDRVDHVIKSLLLEWDLQRMAGVDRNILRLALFEVLIGDDVPPSVAVNEAIELGKAYSTAESGKFINGILGKVLKDIDQYRRLEKDVGV